ncbi:MAG: peptidylprolyl isomerase [Thermodesulfobacteriota bacterium]|nr:peptidylprolyl isomerase [Thermodesulfobacteriota bacterium]
MNAFFKIIAFFIPLTALTAIFSASALSETDIVDRVIAIVNEEIITLSDLESKGEPVFNRIRNTAPAPEVEQAIRDAQHEILTQLINQALILQQAKKLGISVNNSDIDAAINRLLMKNNETIEDLKQELTYLGMSEEEYRSIIRDRMLQSRTINREVRSKIVITDEKIQEYYDTHYTADAVPDGYYILQIGVTWDEKNGVRTKERAMQRAKEIRKMSIKDRDFMELAESYSDLPSARDGGDIGVFKKEEMAAYMRETIIGMQPGEISHIIETPSGYQFFKLLSVKNQGRTVQAEFDSVKLEIKEQLFQEKTKKLSETWLEQLREKAYIKRLL